MNYRGKKGDYFQDQFQDYLSKIYFIRFKKIIKTKKRSFLKSNLSKDIEIIPITPPNIIHQKSKLEFKKSQVIK